MAASTASAARTGGPPSTPDAPWGVSELSTKLKGWIDRLGTVWVEGELTQWNLRGGTAYGKLKDLERDVTVSITAWGSTLARIDGEFSQGDRVLALIKPDYWLKAGSLSMLVYQLRHVGLGDLLERLERLRRSLAAEGLFAPERKRPLPFLPRCIGLVTGKDSDAEKDVLRNAQLRWPNVRFRVRHAAVQGERAAGDVAAGIRELDADPAVEVIIVARGGGDFQNLLVFSDEQLVRAAAACGTPLVSAVGHENDRPLLDEVADLRASTPTDAAKRVVPDVADELSRIGQVRSRLDVRMLHLVSAQIELMSSLRSRPVLADPGRIVDDRAEELTRWVARGSELMEHRLERSHLAVAELTGQLRSLSPRRTLERGYAIAQLPDGRAVRSVTEASEGTPLRITVADGALTAVAAGSAEAVGTPEDDGGRR
ncbi:MAG: exodeoxyribonuclease VII large subunit [Micrococcales bacterium]|nr:exodeoxyribonuclease VII large subunit [Micrococcales bacterium]